MEPEPAPPKSHLAHIVGAIGVLLMGQPHVDRDSFLKDADRLIGELESLRVQADTEAAPLHH